MIPKPGIFISHNKLDKKFARRLATDLQHAGARIWIDEAELRIGDSLIEKIRQGIDEMDYLAVILSQHSVESEWVKKEVEIAMTQEIEHRRVKVLPLLLQDCDLPGFLKGKVYADFTSENKYEPSLTKLLATLDLTREPFTLRLLEKCAIYLDERDRTEAVRRHQIDDRVQLGDWLLMRIRPTFSHDDDERTERFALSADIMKEMHQRTALTDTVTYDLISCYDSHKREFVRYARDLYAMRDSFDYGAPSSKNETKKMADRITSLVHALVTCGHFDHDLFDAGIILESLAYITSEEDQKDAISKYETWHLVEFGDWLLERLEPDTFDTRNPQIVRRFLLLAKIIKGMGVLTERGKRIRDTLIAQSHISYGYDWEYNDYNTNRERMLQRCVEVLGC